MYSCSTDNPALRLRSSAGMFDTARGYGISLSCFPTFLLYQALNRTRADPRSCCSLCLGAVMTRKKVGNLISTLFQIFRDIEKGMVIQLKRPFAPPGYKKFLFFGIKVFDQQFCYFLQAYIASPEQLEHGTISRHKDRSRLRPLLISEQ